MKKMFKFAFLSAIAFVGAVSFTACSSDDKLAEVNNPNFNPETNEVTTQFVFNVSNGNTTITRQSGDATQASSTLPLSKFRGIDNSHVMCFINGDDGNYLTTAATAAKSFDMARVANAGTLSNDQSRRVLEMSLPINTNTMVFYGKAIDETNDYNTYGHLDAFHVEDNLANTYFQLGRRLTAEKKAEFQEIQKLLAACLTCVMGVKRGTEAVSATASPEEGIPAYGFDIASDYMPNMRWKAYYLERAGSNPKQPLTPTDPTKDTTALEIKLYRVYKELTTIQTAELRNASGYAIKETVKALWSIVNSVRCATPTSTPEALAKYMAHLIDKELRNYFNATSIPNDGGSVTGVTIKDASDLITALIADGYWPAEATNSRPTSGDFPHLTQVSGTDLGEFPGQYNLPQGSTHILFNTTESVFTYAEIYNASAVGNGTFTVDDYYYPAELCYFGNSPVRVSDKEHIVNDYPASVTVWNNNATTSWPSDWSVAHVKTSTRSVAMKNDINYGTSLLKTTVGYNILTLKDNNKNIQQRDYGVTEENKTIDVTDNSFKLVGIIVGDQWPKVKWNFLPETTPSDTYRKGYIYDPQIMNNGIIPASTTSASDPNYTLVFDNYQDMTGTDATNKQPKVYIALEFQNNSGVDFFGFDNMIPNGGNFYLIGELDPSTMNGPALPQWHALPPYGTTQYGNQGNTVPRVFIQDHMTTANFKIDTFSLQHAYLSVPDLRSSSVTLGLSVDLQWSTGLTFDNITIGGGEVIYTPNP